eukprot:2765546-Amphidinium_carterae.1
MRLRQDNTLTGQRHHAASCLTKPATPQRVAFGMGCKEKSCLSIVHCYCLAHQQEWLPHTCTLTERQHVGLGSVVTAASGMTGWMIDHWIVHWLNHASTQSERVVAYL